MRTSSIPIALDALEDLLTAALENAGTDGSPIQVSQGLPQYEQRERVEITEVINGSQTLETVDSEWDERFEVTGFVFVSKSPESQRACKNRAFEIYELVKEALSPLDPFGWDADYPFAQVDFAGITVAHGGPTNEGRLYEIGWSCHIVVGV